MRDTVLLKTTPQQVHSHGGRNSMCLFCSSMEHQMCWVAHPIKTMKCDKFVTIHRQLLQDFNSSSVLESRARNSCASTAKPSVRLRFLAGVWNAFLRHEWLRSKHGINIYGTQFLSQYWLPVLVFWIDAATSAQGFHSSRPIKVTSARTSSMVVPWGCSLRTQKGNAVSVADNTPTTQPKVSMPISMRLTSCCLPWLMKYCAVAAVKGSPKTKDFALERHSTFVRDWGLVFLSKQTRRQGTNHNSFEGSVYIRLKFSRALRKPSKQRLFSRNDCTSAMRALSMSFGEPCAMAKNFHR